MQSDEARLGRGDLRIRLALGGILAVAAALRIVGSRFGFPLLFHPDEYAVVDAAVDMARRNSLTPPWSYRPDHVEMKLDLGVFIGYAHLVDGKSVEASFAQDPTPYYFLARLMTGLFGVLTVLVAYLVGARWSRPVGLVAAGLFALFAPFVLNAHFATPDVPLTFAVMVLIWALMRYVESTSWRSLLAAAFAVALAVGIKYPGAVGALMIAVVVGATAWRDRDLRRFVAHGLGSAVAATGFLFVITPTLFLHPIEVREELRFQASGDRLGHPDLGLLGNLRFYAEGFVRPSGLVLAALVLVGLVVVVRSRRLDVLPWFTGLLVWVSLATLPMTWDRWGLPMWTTPLLLGSVGICWVGERCWSHVRLRWLPVLVGFVVAAHVTTGALVTSGSLAAPDTRQVALDWARQHGVTERQSTYEGYTPFLPGTSYLFFRTQVRDRGDRYLFLTTDKEPARYVVLSENMYSRVLNDPTLSREQSIYQYVFDNFDEVATFVPAGATPPSVVEPIAVTRRVRQLAGQLRGDLTGPVIRIFEIPEALRTRR